MNRKNISILGIIFILLFDVSCVSVKPVYFKEDEKQAKEGIAKFQQHFNEQNFEKLFELTSPIAQKEKSKDAFFEAMKNLRKEYGKIQSMDVVESKVKAITGSSRSVSIAYKTKFEKKEDIQLFVWIIGNKDESGLYEYGLADEEAIKRLKSDKN